MGIPPMSSFSAYVSIFCIFVSMCLPIQCASTSITRPESRIIAGAFATEGEFPHQVFMFKPSKIVPDGVDICGGSILSEDYILTAAHCVTNTAPTDIRIVAGKLNIGERQESDIYSAANVTIHPGFNQSIDITKAIPVDAFQNDVAIVKLAKPLPLNGRSIKAIQIDEQNLAIDGAETQAIGWGRTHPTSLEGQFSATLKKASLTVITAICKTGGGLAKLDAEIQICVLNVTMFICQGDSGGPLLCDDGTGTKTNVVCGIASLAATTVPNSPCLGPSVFTRVYHYRDWIKSVSRGFPSHRPNHFVCGISLVLVFILFWE